MIRGRGIRIKERRELTMLACPILEVGVTGCETSAKGRVFEDPGEKKEGCLSDIEGDVLEASDGGTLYPGDAANGDDTGVGVLEGLRGDGGDQFGGWRF